mmetsp:Transcript_57909/g.135553  ORF Transcript_57909/g.135553 Transcript_57909/m.135553 type:complete len:242 (-) Transcript_57909:28-753(-)
MPVCSIKGCCDLVQCTAPRCSNLQPECRNLHETKAVPFQAQRGRKLPGIAFAVQLCDIGELSFAEGLLTLRPRRPRNLRQHEVKTIREGTAVIDGNKLVTTSLDKHIAEVAVKVHYANIQDPNSVNILNCMDSVPEVFRHLGILHECLKCTNFPYDVTIAVDIHWHESLMPASDQRRHGNRCIPLKAIARIQQESRDFPNCPVSRCDCSLPAPGVLLAGVSPRILRCARFFILRLEHCQSL